MKILTCGLLTVSCIALCAADPVLAQMSSLPMSLTQTVLTAYDGGPDTDDGEEIVVSARSLAGRVLGSIPAEYQIDAEDVASYGVSNASELIEELSVLTRSARGRGDNKPVILVNGQRTANENEIRELPTEAILRVDVLSEEVALQYGYSPDQRVLNFVLRNDFRALTTRAEGTFATEGGRTTKRVEGGFIQTTNHGRWSLGADYRHETMLQENERDILQPPADVPDSFAGVFAPLSGNASLDPALDLRAGFPVRYAQIPEDAAANTPQLSTLLPLANKADAADAGAYRSLLPDQHQLRLTSSFNRKIADGMFLTLSGLFEEQKRQSLLGFARISLPLPATSRFSPFAQDVQISRVAGDGRRRAVTDRTLDFGMTLSGIWRRWQWSLTGQYVHAQTDRRTGQGYDTAAAEALTASADSDFNPYAYAQGNGLVVLPDLKEMISTRRWTTDFVINGRVMALPAGDITTSLAAGFETMRFTRRDDAVGPMAARPLVRDRVKMQANVDIPLIAQGMSRVIPGDLSININAAYRDLSDFGRLIHYGAGLNWQPVKPLRLVASFNHEKGPPDLTDLGNPVQVTPGYRLFDHATGTTADVMRIDGGNAALKRDTRQVVKLGLVAEPIESANLTLTADYVWQKIKNPVRSFPLATPEIMAAFPDRFLRDAEGMLIAIDVRPVNLASAHRETLRWGASWRSKKSNRGGSSSTNGPRVPMPGRDQGDRMEFSVFHALHLTENLRISSVGPIFDYLGGSALNDRGGQPRHEIEFRAGISKSGLGMRIEGEWQGATRVNGVTVQDQLRFADYLTMNARVFGNLGKIVPGNQIWAKNMRVTVEVRNILNDRPGVYRVSGGSTPIIYQSAYLEALGRNIRISLRKQF